MESSPNLKKRFFSWRTLFSFAIAFAILFILGRKMDMARVWSVVQNINLPLYGAAFLVYYAAFPIRGLRFRVMLKNNNCSSSTASLTRIILISWFVNCVVPAKLGDIYRAYLVKRRWCHQFADTVGVIFAERVFDLFILYLLIGASGLAAFRGIIPQAVMVSLETSFVILAALFGVLVFMKYYSLKLAARLPQRFGNIYERFRHSTMTSFHKKWLLAALTSAIWFLEGTSFYLVTRAIGLRLPLVAGIFIGLISALLTALPITPAGLGFVESAKAGMLMFFRIDQNVAFSTALMDRAINFASLLVVGFLVYIFTEHRGMAGEVRTDESNDSHSYVQ